MDPVITWHVSITSGVQAVQGTVQAGGPSQVVNRATLHSSGHIRHVGVALLRDALRTALLPAHDRRARNVASMMFNIERAWMDFKGHLEHVPLGGGLLG